VLIIPRPRLHEYLVRKPLGVRIPKWMLDEVDQLGDRAEITEKALLEYLKKIKAQEKNL